MDINTEEVFDIECTDLENTKEPLTTIGKYNFYTAAFEKGNSILINALANNPDWLIIDEAGKLELDGRGFYDALNKITGVYLNNKEKSNLLITVRDSLCEEVTRFFKLKEYRLINRLEELCQPF